MVTNSTANDTARRPIGFGNVLFSEEKEMAPVIALFPVKAAPQPVALAA